MLLQEQLEASVEQSPGKAALVVDGRRYSYAEIDQLSAGLAATLQRRGVKRGDRVALFLPNSAELVIGIYAALRVGAIFMPISPQTKATKLLYILQDSTPACVIADRDLDFIWEDLVGQVGSIHTMVVRGREPERAADTRNSLAFAAAVAPEDGRVSYPGTIDHTSGSTGYPKGVMLTHRNVGTNVESFNGALNLRANDTLIGVLPFFHSFGYTVAMWAALMLPPKVAYHVNPLDARQVGELSRKQRATLLVVAPTFLRGYLRRVPAEDFATLDLIVTGAEKLPPDLSDAVEKKFNLRPVEGYGTTELSPVVSVNIPAQRAPDGKAAWREGTVGRPIPGVQAKVVDLETGEDLGPEKSGMLLIKGPNVMKGYLGQPDLTAEVIRDGWYVTGDIAMIDPDGYIRITGRESRFSKIGGEMVPHIRIEEALGQVLDLDEEKVSLAVTGVPDPRKGERLVVLHTGLPKTPEGVCRELAGTGFPPIWIPSPDSFFQVDEIPILGTGKVDLRRLKELASEKASSD